MERILMIGIGWEQIPMVKKAKEKGLYVIATTWWDQDRIPADKIYTVDSSNLSELEKIYLKEKPQYIIADECDYSMYAVAYLTDKYNLPGPSLRVQAITNNKYLQRESLSNTDVLQPKYRLCWNIDMAKKFAIEVEYPIVIKPVDNRGSIGVSKVYSEREIEEAWFLAITNTPSHMCIVEKCINGDVITADGFCDSDGYEFISPSNKDMYDNNSNLAKVVYYPGKFSAKLFQKIKLNAEKIVDSIGIKFGFVHIEFIIEKETEEVYLVEVANRGGGVYTSNIVLKNITGIDYCEKLIDLAMGKNVYAKCNQNYINKSIIYFLELSGNSFITSFKKENNCDALFINKKRLDADTAKEAAIGRHGVSIWNGNDFESMIQEAREVEKIYTQSEEEYFWLKE